MNISRMRPMVEIDAGHHRRLAVAGRLPCLLAEGGADDERAQDSADSSWATMYRPAFAAPMGAVHPQPHGHGRVDVTARNNRERRHDDGQRDTRARVPRR